MHRTPHSELVQPRSEVSHANHDLPYEILIPIFRLTQPLAHEYSPSIVLGPRNPWLVGLRTKKALTLVCKTWSRPATAFLYEDIVLRRMGQIVALANTLLHRDSGQSLAQLVQSIRLQECIVLRHCVDSVRESLGHILRQCSGLSSFTYHPTSSSVFPVDRRYPFDHLVSNINPCWLLGFGHPNIGHALADRLQQSIRTLDFHLEDIHDEKSFVGPLYAMLGSATHITSLVLSAFKLNQHRDDWLLGAPPLRFPALHTLRIRLEDPHFKNWMCQRWQMPELRSLTYRSHIGPVELLEAHGSRLTYAALDCGSHVLSQLSRLLPVVTHLTIPLLFDSLGGLVIDSPTLRYLDIRRSDHPTFSDYKCITVASRPRVPALKRIRLLTDAAWDVAALYPSLLDPELLPVDVDGPETPQGRQQAEYAEQLNTSKNPWNDWMTGGVIHRVHGEVLRQKWWGVAHDPYWCPKEEYSEYDYGLCDDVDSSSDDGSYVYESAPPSESDVGSETIQYFEDVGAGEQLDRDTILSMFRRGLEGDYLLSDDDGSSDDS